MYKYNTFLAWLITGAVVYALLPSGIPAHAADSTTADAIICEAAQASTPPPSTLELEAASASEIIVIGIDGSNGKDVINNNQPTVVDALSDTSGEDVTGIGISGGNGKDKITNRDLVDVNVAAAAPDTLATALGIDAGNGQDTVRNEGTVDAASESSAIVSGEEWNFIGVQRADMAINSWADSIGISGGQGSGKDNLINDGDVTATAQALTKADTITGTFAGAAGSTIALNADAHAAGIAAGNGQDNSTEILSAGTVTVAASATADSNAVSMTFLGASDSSTPMTAHATAEGITGGNGMDTIVNEGALVVSATAKTESLGVALTFGGSAKTNEDAAGNSLAESEVIGLSGGDGKDDITNAGSIAVFSLAEAHSEDVAVSIKGTASAGSSLTARSTAIGIEGGSAKDVLSNTGTLNVTSYALTYGLSADINAVDVTQTDLTRVAESRVVGMDGSGADDVVTNSGLLTASALSRVEAWTIDVNAIDTAIVDASITATSEATGMTGGKGREELENSGTVTAAATSSVQTWTFELTGVDLALGNSSVTQDATAVGIDARIEDEYVVNTGTVNAIASCDATVGGVTLALVDLTVIPDILKKAGVDEDDLHLGNASTTLTANAAGILTDTNDPDHPDRDADDTVINHGNVAATATAEALSIGVGIGAEGIPSGLGDAMAIWKDANLADASTVVTANAVGIDAGNGENTIDHQGSVSATAEASVTGVNASLSLPLLEPIMNVPSPAFALAKEGSEAHSTAVGIRTGDDADEISSSGTVNASADSTAIGVSAAIIFQGVLDSIDTIDLAFGRADANTTTTAAATGIDSGKSDDLINNSAVITSEADATTVGVAVSFALQNKVEGPDKAPALKKTLDIEGTLADAQTFATTSATGIAAGEGDDEIDNSGAIIADAYSTTVGVALAASVVNKGKEALIANGAIARADATGEADAAGILAGDGLDTVNNSGAMTIDAHSTVVGAGIALTVQGTNTKGAGLMASLLNTTTSSTANAVAIDGGAQASDITNTARLDVDATAESVAASVGITMEKSNTKAIGISLANAQSFASTEALGIVTEDDADTVYNTGDIDADATTVAVAASVSVVRKGVAAGATVEPASFDSGNVGEATAKAITTGDGDDTITSHASLTASADTTTPSVGVAVSAKGISAALTTSEGEATGIGIESGAGADTVVSSGSINADALATAVAVSVSVSNEGLAVAGDMVWDGGTEATSVARGIDLGTGDDTLANSAVITAESTAIAPSVGVAVTGKGISAAVSTATSYAEAMGVSAGDGNEQILNTGAITASSLSNADAITVAISGKGVAATLNDVWDGGVEAKAVTRGIDAGAGDETITNYGKIMTEAEAVSVSVGVSVVGKGIAASVGTSTAEAESVGIEGGLGTANISNYGEIVGETDATAVGVSVDVAGKGIAGAADGVWDGGTTATATTHGIHTDASNDNIVNTGKIDVESDAIAPSVGISVTGKGISAAVTTATSYSEAIGLDSGAGDDSIINTGYIKADAFANADAISVAISGKGIAASANDVWDGGVEAKAVASGIDAGPGSNTVANSGAIEAEAEAVTVSVALSVVGQGIAGAISTSTAEAEATGINLGDRTTDFANTGPTITAEADATAVAVNIAVSGKGVAAAADAVWDGGASATAKAKGIEAGYVDNVISNTAAITADAGAVSPSVGVAISGQGLTAAVTSATATSNAVGINTNEGNDTIHNLGTIDSDATSTAVAVSVAVSGKGVAGAADAVWDGGTTAQAYAGGIEGGTGANTVVNEALIDTNAEAVTVSVAASIVGQGVALSSSTSTADAISTAVNLGDGSGYVHNKGLLVTDADSTAVNVTVSIAGQGIAGSADAVWDGGTKSTAATAGILSGDSDDVVWNEAKIDSETDAVTVSAGISIVGTGIGLSTSTSTAEGMTAGINSGDGSDTILNSGVIETDATATAVSAQVSIAGTGIAGSADAVWDGGTKATAGSTGIAAGNGDNAIINTAMLDSESDATTVSAAISIAGTGIGLASSTSTALSGTAGIVSGTGADTIENSGAIVLDSSATAVSVQVSIVGTGIAAASDAVWDGGTKADAYARGLDSGAGSDIIKNTGAITSETDATTVSAAVSIAGTGVGISMSGATATAESIGIATGAGVDQIENTACVDADASSTAVGVSVSITGLGVSGAGGSVWDGGITGNATAKAIDTGADNDVVTNSGALVAEADTTATSVGVAITGKGIAFTTATSTAEAVSNAIDAGAGDDYIANTGTILAGAESDAVTVQVSVAGLGLAGAADSVWDNGTTSTATARGIYGDAGADEIRNSGAVVATGEADTTSVAVSATLAGVAATAATSYAETEAHALDGGVGDDIIVNTANLAATADSSATTVAVAVVGAGVALAADSVWDNGTTAMATARDVYGDEGTDNISSVGDVLAIAEANAASVAVTVTLAGVAGTVATSTAVSESNAFDGGAGDDAISSVGTITSTAIANADTVTVSIAGIGAALAADSVWDGGTTAGATGRGIYGGSGNDILNSDGVILVVADAETDSTAVTATLAGVAGIVVSSTAAAVATGMDGDKGNDTIESLQGITSVASADASSVQVSISGLGASISADSAWDGGTTSIAVSRGLAGGEGNDTLLNKGAIAAASTATADSTAVAVSLAGIASTTAVSNSTAIAAGIDGGAGNDGMENTAAINAVATSEATALSVSVVGLGVAAGDNPFWDHTTTGTAIALGLSGGEGNDTIINRQAVTIGVNADAEATEVSVALVGVTFGDTATAAYGIGTGIDGGAGDDTIFNEGAIVVGAAPETDGLMARAEADSVGVALVGAAIGDASATAGVTSRGIEGGTGDDYIENEGALTILASAGADVKATTVGILGYAGQEANAVAMADAAGIGGGDGDDTLLSKGVIASTATTTVSLDAAAFTFGGAASSKGSTTAVTFATGMSGGAGEDGIRGEATINAAAVSVLVSESNTTAIFGAAGSEATSGAVTLATGIDGGDDADIIENMAAINATSSAALTLDSSGFTLGGSASQETKLAASTHSVGISGGSGADMITGEGPLTVSATSAMASGTNSTTIFGGAQAKATSGALTTATGIDGGDDGDVIQSKGDMAISSTANMTMSSTSFSFAGTGASEGMLAASTQAAGIGGGSGADIIFAEGNIGVTAAATLSSLSQATTVFGSSASKAKSGAFTTAAGIDGGEDDDFIESDAAISVSSGATLTLLSTTFVFGGTASAEGTMAASTYATGITGGEGADTILAGGTVSAASTAIMNSSVNAKAAFGSASARGTSGAITGTNGIDGGAGNDVIDSTADIIAASTALMTMNASSYVFGGSSAADSALTASTRSAGIAGGEGEDWIRSAGDLNVAATSYLTALGNSNATFGSASATTATSSSTDAIGISGGEGGGYMENSGVIAIASNTYVSSTRSAFSFAGGSAADAVLTARGDAAGFRGGAGTDTVINDGSVTVTTYSEMTASGGTSATFGDTSTDGLVTAEASGAGVDVGAGGDMVHNMDTIAVTVSIDADSTNTSDAGLFFYDGGTRSRAGATFTGYGIRASSDDPEQDKGDEDIIINDGTINLTIGGTANANATANGGDVAWFTGGDASTTAATTVTSNAYGITADADLAVIINNGHLNVSTAPSSTAYSLPTGGAFGSDADGWGYGAASGYATAYGALATGQENWIENAGQVDVYVSPYVYTHINAQGSTSGGSGDADAYGASYGSATAYGLATGSGEGHVLNDGGITVYAVSSSILWSHANGQGADGDGRTGSWSSPMDVKANAYAAGISTGTGDSEIDNTGFIDVTAQAYADVYGTADADTGGGANSMLESRAWATAAGFEAGQGSNIMSNSGTINVLANSYAKSYGWADRESGGAVSYSQSPAYANAFGVSAGSGDDFVFFVNSGIMNIVASAFSDTYAHGDVDSYAYAKAYGNAVGVSVSESYAPIAIENSGTMLVSSSSMAFVQDDEPDMQATAGDTAYGVKVFNGGETYVGNTGFIQASSYASSFFQSYNDWRSAQTSNSTAVGIAVDGGDAQIYNDGEIEIYADADNLPKDYSAKRVLQGYHGAAGWGNGIQTGDGDDTVVLDESSLIGGEIKSRTISANGQSSATATAVTVGDGTNAVANYGEISLYSTAVADIFLFDLLGIKIAYPSTASATITGISAGTGGDLIQNYGNLGVSASAYATTSTTPDITDWQVATVTAYGINAGDGNNIVENYGTIGAHAFAVAGAGNAGGGSTATTAIGIKTGNGDDTILNAGTIDTWYYRHQTPSSTWYGPGTAIDSGAGNDAVALDAGSVTNGTVSLGAGDDAVLFLGSATVTGTIGGDEGRDSLLFSGDGNLDANFSGFEGDLIKTAPGTFHSARVPQAMNRVIVQQGTLDVGGDYTFASDGMFSPMVNGDGTCGQLSIAGQAALAGRIDVLCGTGCFVDGRSYDVLTANEISGTFDTGLSLLATPLIGFDVTQLDDRVQVETNLASATTVATTPMERAVALGLDSVTPNADENLAELIGQFQQLPLGEHSEALQELSPQTFADIGQVSLDISRQYVSVLQERMNRLRNAQRYAEAMGDDEPIQLAFGGSLADLRRMLMETGDAEIAPCGFWMEGFGQWGDQKSRRGQAGYDFNQGGSTLGFDYAFGDDFLAGISVNYSYTDFNVNRGLGHGIIDGYGGSVYGSWLFGKGGYVEGSLSYARQRYDTNRLITVGAITTMASGKHYGNAYSASLGGGYDISLSKWTLGPFGSLNYTRLEEDGFTESGSGAALRVSDRKTDNLVSNLGVRLARPVELKRGLLVPEITASWLHDFAIDDNVVTASFADAPGAPFSIRGPRTERDGMSLGAGLKFLQRGGFSCGIQYNTELREGFTAHRVAGQVRFEFGRKQ